MIVKQSSQKILLISLPILFLLILSYEAGIFKLAIPSLYAQNELQPLVLQKGNSLFTIENNLWIVILDKSNEKVIGSGKLVDVNEHSIKLMEESEKVIFKDEIGTLYLGEAKRVGHYAGQGFKVGGIIGLVGGGILGTMCLFSSTGYGYDVTDYLMGYVGGTLFTSIYSVPIATVIGTLNGLSKNSVAKKFIIAPDEWGFQKGEEK